MQASFVSMTTDLGTEVGMAQFHQQSLNDLLPDWMGDVFERDVESEGADDRDLNVDGSWMPNAFIIPGMLHVTSNLSKEVGMHLRGWDDFWKQLSNIEELLCKQDNKDKLLTLRVFLPAHAETVTRRVAQITGRGDGVGGMSEEGGAIYSSNRIRNQGGLWGAQRRGLGEGLFEKKEERELSRPHRALKGWRDLSGSSCVHRRWLVKQATSNIHSLPCMRRDGV